MLALKGVRRAQKPGPTLRETPLLRRRAARKLANSATASRVLAAARAAAAEAPAQAPNIEAL